MCSPVSILVKTQLGIPIDRSVMVCYTESAVIWGVCVWVCGVMRKTTTTLTYRGDKVRARYQVLKKIFWGKKMPVRLLYENVWGTTISPLDEVSYIVSCLRETVNIVGSNYVKKISRSKK
jgi:hypothetical protein